MAETINGVPIGDLPGIESVPDDSMLVVEFLGKAYHMPGAVLRQMIQDVLDSMGDSVDDVTEARLTAAIETVLSSGKYHGVSPSVEVLDEEDGTSVIHVIDAFGDKRYPVEVNGARNAVQYVEQELTDEQKAQARKNIGVGDGAGTADAVQYVPQTLTTEQQTQARNNIGISDYVSRIGILLSPNPDFTSQHVIMDWYMNGNDDDFGRFTFDVPYSAYELAQKQGYIKDETTFYKEMSSNLGNPKADSLQIDSDTGTLMLLSAGEPIGEAVTLPTGNADDSKIFIADLNTSTYEDIKAADDAGKICYALWGGYTACMLTTLSPESAIFTTLLDPHLGLYVKFTKGTVGVSDFGLTESHSVLYEPQSLTDAQKAQARENIGALSADDIDVDSIGSNVFVGNYDTVTFTEIKAAHDAGKVCFVKSDGMPFCQLLGIDDSKAIFIREINDTTDYKVTFTSAGGKDFTLVDKNTPIYVAQTLSDAQKAQARTNIGAAAAADLSKYVTTGTAQTIKGAKIFNAPANVAGKEQHTVKFKTSNGGAIIFGKEAANSGTMLRFDQVDGTTRLRFRGSDSAGAIVWEQPEQGAQLCVDLGKQGVDKHRIKFPSSGGTLALTSQIPSLSGYLPLSGGLMTGSLKFQEASLPGKSLQYICGIDAFANGGEMGWQSKADFLSGYATTGGNVNTSTMPLGFASRVTGATWGNTIGTSFTGWNDPTGGSIDFRQDNPSSGKMSIKVNGRVYVNEGNNPVMGTELAGNLWGMTSPDGENNVWIRTTTRGIVPYQSGAAGAGHCSLGTYSWYFASAYIDKVYGSNFSGLAAKATADGNGRNIASTYATKDEVVTAANGSLKVTLSGTSVDKTLAQIETALNAGRHVYMVENDGQVYQLSMHMAGMMACFTSVVTSGTQVTVKTVIVYDGMEPSVFTKTL